MQLLTWRSDFLKFCVLAALACGVAAQGSLAFCQTYSTNATPAAQKFPNHVKRGSINDVNAVGHRKIGGRGFGNWYSTETEMVWGNQIAQQVQRSARILHDPVVEEYVNRLGQKIVKNSDAKVPFTIKVIDSKEINAFALPGGYFYVNSGLILAADNEAELAGAMAHEIAHVAAHHQAREMTRMHYADLGMAPLVMMTGYSMVGYGIYNASAVTIPLTFLQFQRDFEEQADWLGVQYLYKSGYDPQQMITFFKKIETLQKSKPGIVSKAFSTHPQTPGRIARTQKEIATILPPKQKYIVNTSGFHAVQKRLIQLENCRAPSAGKPSETALCRAGVDRSSDSTKGRHNH